MFLHDIYEQIFVTAVVLQILWSYTIWDLTDTGTWFLPDTGFWWEVWCTPR